MFASEVETIEEGARAAREAVNRGAEELRDLKEDATHRVKRHPLESVGAAFGVGLLLGGAVGWIAQRSCRRA